jgi:hypothetical protein
MRFFLRSTCSSSRANPDVLRASGSSCVLSILDDEGLLAGFEPEGGRLELQRPPRCSTTALIRIQVSLSRRCALSLQLPHTATRIVRSLAPAESIAETPVTAGFKPQHSHMRRFGSDKRANICALGFLAITEANLSGLQHQWCYVSRHLLRFAALYGKA